MKATDSMRLIEKANCHAFIAEDGIVHLVGRANVVHRLLAQLEPDAIDNLRAWLSEHGVSRAGAALGSLRLKRKRRARPRDLAT